MKRFFVPLLLLFFLSCSRELKAHPHVFIDTRVTVVFDDRGITGCWIVWEFDEMFSAMIIQDFDEDYDSSFSRSEIENIEENAFSNLKNFHYFSYISWNGKEYDGKRIEQFSAAIEGNTLIYSFFVPFRISEGEGERLVKISVYDDSYYCDVAFSENEPVYMENGDLYSVRYEIVQDKSDSYYYGQVFPQQILLYFRKKDG